VRLVDCLAHRPAERRKRCRRRIDMFPSGEDLAGVDRQRRRLHGYRLKPALGGAAQRRDPLGEQIAEFFGGLCDLVEEFMEGDKVRPLTFQCAAWLAARDRWPTPGCD